MREVMPLFNFASGKRTVGKAENGKPKRQDIHDLEQHIKVNHEGLI